MSAVGSSRRIVTHLMTETLSSLAVPSMIAGSPYDVLWLQYLIKFLPHTSGDGASAGSSRSIYPMRFFADSYKTQLILQALIEFWLSQNSVTYNPTSAPVEPSWTMTAVPGAPGS